jgi:SagB-type dehydrogenase family enzyme
VGGFVLGRLAPRQRGAEPLTEAADLGAADLGAADLGAFYHQWSKPGHGPALSAAPDWGRQPPRTKTYPAASRVPLPDPSGWQALSLEQTIESRRSVRDYAAQPLTLDALSRLLHAAQGITEPRRSFRAAPSAGALYPIELYPVVRDVAGLDPGLYHYAVQEHALEQVLAGDLRSAVMQAGLGQAVLGQAAVCFVLSAIFQRTRYKYRERAYRYVLLEAGHVGQNLCLAATGLGLGACTVGAFDDDDLNELLGLDGQEEAALYIIAVGQG